MNEVVPSAQHARKTYPRVGIGVRISKMAPHYATRSRLCARFSDKSLIIACVGQCAVVDRSDYKKLNLPAKTKDRRILERFDRGDEIVVFLTPQGFSFINIDALLLLFLCYHFLEKNFIVYSRRCI